MKTIAIQSGKFTESGKNFTGYTASGQRVNVYAPQLAAIGITPEAPATFPLYALVEKRSHEDKTGKAFDRWDAGSVFTTADAMLQASIADAALAIKGKQMLTALAKEAGISADAMAELTADAF